MNYSKSLFPAVCGALAFSLASPALGAVTSTGPFAGVSVTYSDVIEQSADPINDPVPLYGDAEILTGDILAFSPAENPFAADSPLADTTDGALSFTVTSNSGGTIPSLIVSESGDYGFLGNSAGASVQAGLFVQILDPVSGAILVQESSTFSSSFTSFPTDDGFWSNEVVIDLSSLGLTEFDVIIDNRLMAAGPNDVAAAIRKKTFQVDVPEPGTMALFAGGLALMTLRRKSA